LLINQVVEIGTVTASNGIVAGILIVAGIIVLAIQPRVVP